MENLIETKIKNLIKEYRAWKRNLKHDIETYDDTTAIEQKGTLYAVEIIIQDLKNLQKMSKRG